VRADTGDKVLLDTDDDPASMVSQYVDQARGWFDTLWNTVSSKP